MSGRTVVIAGLSVRALAQSARRAGYMVHAVDLFADSETREAATSARTVSGQDGGFDVASLRQVVGEVVTQERPALAVYGGGWECIPACIDEIFRSVVLAGNSASVVEHVTDPGRCLPTLAQLGIPHPPTITSGRVPADGWLIKQVGGCGGAHVRAVPRGLEPPAGSYAQQRVAGQSMSALMLADGNTAELLGCCQHWCAQPGLISEFQHSAMVRARPHVSLLETIAEWAQELASGFNLRGLCGFDFVLQPDGAPILLEINPRPPASFELFEADEGLFTAHVEACNGRLVRHSLAASIRAAAVYYASRDWRAPAAFPWPQWSRDRPLAGADVARGQPLCSVFSESDTSAHARDVTQQRVHELDTLLNMAADGQSIWK